VDMGLTRGQPAPPIHSRMAAEVARRVQAWVVQHDGGDATAARVEDGGWNSPYEMPYS